MITSMLEQILLALPLIIGAYLSVSLLKLPDLSLESAYLFGAALAVSLHPLGLPNEVAAPALITAAMIGGALVGAVSSLINQLFRLPFLLTAIITNGLFHGLTQFVLGNSIISLSSTYNPLQLLSSGGQHTELPMLALIGLILSGLATLGLRSQLGVSYAIYGNNPGFFRHYGVSTRFVVCSGVMIADALAGLSGYIFVQSNGFVDLSMGYGVVLLCITALVLGKTVIRTHKPTILVPIAGLGIYFLLQQLLLVLGLNLQYFNSFQALLILIALLAFKKTRHTGQSLLIDHLGV